MFGKKERELTCKRCGTVFYRPNKKMRAPNRAEIAGAKMQAAGSSASLFLGGANRGGYQMQAQALEQKRALALENNKPHCPNCGSGSVSTKIVKK